MKLRAIGLQLNEKRHDDYNAYDPDACGPFWNHEHKIMQMMHVLHKLTLLTSNLAEEVKDVHGCKETAFYFIWYFI